MSQKNLKSKTRGLQVININCAGIDLGSKSHWVCCPTGNEEQEVREFKSDTTSLAEDVPLPGRVNRRSAK